MAQSKTRRLRAPQGVDEASFGTQSFPVEGDRTVEVPSEAVDSLTGVGGFVLADVEVAPAPEGFVEIDHEDQGASLSVAGQSYSRGEDGRMFVPLAAAPDLEAHGFRLVSLEEATKRATAALESAAAAAEAAEAEAARLAAEKSAAEAAAKAKADAEAAVKAKADAEAKAADKAAAEKAAAEAAAKAKVNGDAQAAADKAAADKAAKAA